MIHDSVNDMYVIRFIFCINYRLKCVFKMMMLFQKEKKKINGSEFGHWI